jgi:RNA polymerase sigma-70 factor (ECF subfamily)
MRSERQDSIAVQPKLAVARDSHVDDAAIWRKHKEELIRYATILVGLDRAEDVLSTVVERILRRSGSLVALDDARPYLFRAVLNESRGVLRRSSVTPWERDFVEDSIGFRPDVAAAVGTLPERQRAAVYLTYWRDLPVSEVADLMGCRPGTVKRYLHLSRNRLKEVLEP